MATENIVLLACATVICGLHVVGGPLSGLFRPMPVSRRPRPSVHPIAPRDGRASTPPDQALPASQSEIVSRAS
jgi:hypothetical protein